MAVLALRYWLDLPIPHVTACMYELSTILHLCTPCETRARRIAQKQINGIINVEKNHTIY
jgi:hypothetical protein